jgi:hypothetical protein
VNTPAAYVTVVLKISSTRKSLCGELYNCLVFRVLQSGVGLATVRKCTGTIVESICPGMTVVFRELVATCLTDGKRFYDIGDCRLCSAIVGSYGTRNMESLLLSGQKQYD